MVHGNLNNHNNAGNNYKFLIYDLIYVKMCL
uniref:Uncharacterized protein n=1 Tax=Candidatus Nitrotoga fabula TaxID=2182327 RepID=A0A2X0QSS9_9PROT|nr:protein of unknown function [Candidatus Nitrotoga fabula]